MEKNGHYTFSHYDNSGNIVYKEKKSFDAEKSAIYAAMIINTKAGNNIRIVAYKCKVCGKYHLGHNGHFIDDNEKDKIKMKAIKIGILK